jgi:heme-degrading monooxygenase HmoA
MKSLLLTAPILPGKLDAWRRCVSELLGVRHDGYHQAMRQGGVTRLRVWRQQTPDGGDQAVVLYEGPRPELFLQNVATSQEPFWSWLREELTVAHGMDFSAPPPPPPELVIDEQLGLPTVYSLSRVAVEDPERWSRAMDELEPLRVEHGQISKQILRSENDGHQFAVLFGWQSEDDARRFYAHPELRAKVEHTGGVEGRGLEFLVGS